MSQTIEKAAHSLDSSLAEIAPIMAEQGDKADAARLLELREKLGNGQLTVAFCGHFSAGKSTLVNRLCGTQLLPSSPIPTSANVVSIVNGDAKATIKKLVAGEEQTIEVPVDQVNAYCKDGETVLSVSLSYPIPRLGTHTVLLDTPGIDSTDDAHRMATESALHLADVVFYVMDYNHVQSEINFTFAKQLKEWGKPLYLIVNQIDKHRERELSFEAYKQSVDEAFSNWHLEPSGIIYLSLREPNHPHSELTALEGLFESLAAIRGPLAVGSVDASARYVVRMHGKYMEEATEAERERLVAEAGGEGEADRLRDEIAGLEEELRVFAAESEGLKTKLRLEIQSILDNANITPAPTRDLAHTFLESRKPGFKAGLLFAGAKTAAEQERRLNAFFEDIDDRVRAGIEWHVLDVLRKAADAIGWRDESLEQELKSQFSGLLMPELLVKLVNTGAVFGNEYTMTYSRDLAAEVKGLFRKRALEWIDALAKRAAAAGEAAAAPLRARLAELAQQAGALAQLAALEHRAAAHLARLAALLPPAPPRPELPKPQTAALGSGALRAPGAVPAADGEAAAGTGAAALAREAAAASAAADLAADADAAAPHALAPQRQAAERLTRAAELLAAQPSLATTVAGMRDKAERLRSSRFTIALFGAFSAGKSSLANALLGDAVLPVSPNPTTAAVNRIVAPTEAHPHGTATVLMKSRQAMLDDLRYSLELLGEDAQSLSDAALLQAIVKLTPDAVHAGGRPHYSFLKAAAKGWAAHEALLGQQLAVSGEEYRSYVADESRSCYVSEIELHHRNPLTAQGIVLVDTPGADSVNARHTGVAFNYIKNADAILFVTYYNHAFSQADRQFLMQLGRVKDQFELDKMFFIVNAADLAASEQERDDVLTHVERNLQQHGIRFPRMFPVSSLDALDGKQSGNAALVASSGISAFEDSFLSFTQNDLGALAVGSAEQELERARRTIANWLEAASGDALSREQARAALQASADEARALAAAIAESPNNQQLQQELKELLFYVLQRVQLRFGDHYNFAFNPSVLQDDGRDLKKAMLTCWLELQRLLQIELAQELEATSLRLDNALNKLAAKKAADTAEESAQLLPGFSPSGFKPLEIATPEERMAWQARNIDMKLLWSKFKSPRHFFEGEGKAALRSLLENELAAPLQSWISEAEADWSERYAQLWQQAMNSCESALQQDISSFSEGKLSSMSDNANLEALRSVYAELLAI
ncbi:dynamin family protein [Paenibacillus sp. OV219]|uniref:dynamin family protein n=1 Tax=Paenibacillus sp. OV219 TaxID=1884377 RepID=UPI0008C9E414|nr:dynamin family protein [Paenibacillus sp. OV219]SEM77934.1 small GTP-binding protein domain-containing protein [Paenibacillus sp. OV219]